MSFLFNFEPDEDDVDHKTSLPKDIRGPQAGDSEKEPESGEANVSGAEAKEITEFCNEELISKLKTVTMEFGQQRLRMVDTSELGNMITNDASFRQFAESKNLVRALSSNSDLVAGVYEGGLKMWECGEDLTHFLSSHPVGQTLPLKGKSVLELGCGAGLPGIYCCGCGAKTVHFQDFNEEVLQLITHTNATYNTSETSSSQCKYYSGDWTSFKHLLQREKQTYDIILTAETIYSPENYSSLHDVFRTALAHDGVIVVAAKVYYFGVGGSIDGFIEYVESQHHFTTEIVHTIKTGVPRKILLLHSQEKSSLPR